MPLVAGNRLGPYEVVAPLGAGGMGEVYRARDTRLGREVAIKVLPPHLSSSEEMRQRFEREARTISQLSHPHICALYDVGREGETQYLVMELLEGEALSARLAKGPMPLELVLRYGVEIADALDKAHRAGIVHRDLKPGNMMLTKSGVKLLDFGLAKALDPEGPIESFTSAPTAAKDVTAEGAILGTLSYMAPEQVEGKKVDSRTDIFALGATLYEMTTGRKAFSGSSQASLITAIMSADPPALATMQPMTPRALDRLVKKCLAKDPEQRWQSASDLADELTWVRETGFEADTKAPVGASRRGPFRSMRLAWAVGLVGVLALVSALALVARGRLQRAPESAGTVRFLIPAPDGWNFWLPYALSVGAKPPIAVSPNGQHIAFVAVARDGKILLWVRPLDSLTARALIGTDDASSPFWSPDSRTLGFFAGGKLKKIDASGGPPVTLCDAPDNRGGAWSRDGTILFAPSASVATRLPTGLQKVSASGGAPQPATVLAAGEASHVGPAFLPDGGSRIVYSMRVNGTLELYQKAASGAGAEQVLLTDHRNKFPACWSPDGRFILYMVDNGAPTNWDLWLLPLFGDRKPYPFLQTPFNEAQGRFSPDGRWVAYISNESGRYEAYVAPFPGPGGKWQVSSGGGVHIDGWPRWRRDGKEISYRAPDGTIMAAAVNGQGTLFETGEVRSLFAPPSRGPRWPYDVAPDGRFLINTVVEQGASAPFAVVVNWTSALKK